MPLRQLQRRGTAILRDSGLLQMLRSEINHELLSSSIESSHDDAVGSMVGGFRLEWAEQRSQDVVLRKQPDHVSSEEIVVSALLAPLQWDEDPLPRDVLMKVCIRKTGYDPLLCFNCHAFRRNVDGSSSPWTTMEVHDSGIHTDFTIRRAYYFPSMDHLGKRKSMRPIFSSLDAQLKKELKEYLVARGITPKLTNFLLEHLNRKEHCQYVTWLRTLEGIVAKEV